MSQREEAARPAGLRGTAEARPARSRIPGGCRSERRCTRARTAPPEPRRLRARPARRAAAAAAPTIDRQASPRPIGKRGRQGGRLKNAAPPRRPSTNGRRRPCASNRAANVRTDANSWPVCQTPPRIVIHHIAVLSPKRMTSQARSAVRDAEPACQSPEEKARLACGDERVHHGLPRRRDGWPNHGNQGSQAERGKWREGHEEPRALLDEVVDPEGAVQPGPSMQEGVGKVEEVRGGRSEPSRADEEHESHNPHRERATGGSPDWHVGRGHRTTVAERVSAGPDRAGALSAIGASRASQSTTW